MESSVEPVKVVLLGESGVGKNSIISQFTSNNFENNNIKSLSAQYVSKIVEYENFEKSIKFDIWDTAGQEKYRSLAKIFYKDAKVIILVYDITNLKSFIGIKSYWYIMVKQSCDPNAIIAIVGNKSDLYNEQQVNQEEVEEFARSVEAIFQLTSAKNDTGITTLFDNIGQKYLNPNYDCISIDKNEQDEYRRKKTEERLKRSESKKVIKINSDTYSIKKRKKKNIC